MLRGVECDEPFVQDTTGHLRSLGGTTLDPGDVTAVSPRIGDLHRVANTGAEDAVSIHVYGDDIGRIERHTFDLLTGEARPFVSGYSALPAG